MRRMGQIKWFDAALGYGLIHPFDKTNEFVVYAGDFDPRDIANGIVSGAVVSFRERFACNERVAVDVEFAPANVVPLTSVALGLDRQRTA